MLTFETIRELERAERESKKLQRIPDTFLAELKDYIARKELAPGEVQELPAVKSTIARLLELRERKIVDTALITARTGLPPENLQQSESELFWGIVERLKRFREEFLGKLHENRAERTAWRVVKSSEFVGPDLKEYKLQQGDTIELPAEIVDILLKTGVVEEAK